MSDPKGYVTNTRYIEALCRFFGVQPNELFAFGKPIEPDGMTASNTQEREAATNGDSSL